MLKLYYIVCFAFMFFSSCTRQGPYVSGQSQQLTDSTVLIQTPFAENVNGVSVEIDNLDTNSKSFYITPADYDFGSYEKLMASIVSPLMSDEQKVNAIWQFTGKWSSHSLALMNNQLPHDPLRLFNSFQSGLCDDRNSALAIMFKLAGLKSRVYHLGGHIVSEVYYNNSWHMYDADWHVVFRANGEVASVDYIGKHPEILHQKESYPDRLSSFFGPYIFHFLYGSTGNNVVEDWFIQLKLDYSNKVTLNKADKLNFSVNHTGLIGKVRMLFGSHKVNNVKALGKLERRIAATSNEYLVFKEQSPYAITNVSITSVSNPNQFAVYYSNDSVNWFLKGIMGEGMQHVEFRPSTAEHERVVFSYYLRFIPLNNSVAIAKNVFSVKNDILFSSNLLTNPTGLSVIPLADSGSVAITAKAYSYK